MNKTELLHIIQEYGLHPNKRLGQNFLVANDIRDRIIGVMGLSVGDRLLEIGPGLGALTEFLVRGAEKVVAVEIDSGLSRYLGDRFSACVNFTLIHGDFLKDPPDGTFTKIVSNLPYYCASEILFGLPRYGASKVFVMIQKELADRIAALPGDKNYGALSVALGFYYVSKILFRVSKESFYPRPEVTSSFVGLTLKDPLPLQGADIERFHRVVKSAFWGRRKTILKALSDSPHLEIGKEGAGGMLAVAGIDGTRRGEELGLDEYVALARAYKEL